MFSIFEIFYKKYKSFVTYFSFSMATSALGFLASIIMMNLMPPEEFGRIALFLSVHFFIAPLISISAENLLAIKKTNCCEKDYIYFRMVYVTFSYAAFVAVQFAFLFVYKIYGNLDWIFLLIPAVALVKFLITMASIEYVMEEKSVQYGVLTFASTLLSLLLTVLFLTKISATADCRIAALLAADVAFILVRYKGRFKLLTNLVFAPVETKALVRFGFPLLLSVAPAWALNESDKFVVANFTDLASVGVYAAAGAIGSVLVTFNAALLNSMTPELYKILNSQSEPLIYTVKYAVIKFLKGAVAFSFIYGLAYTVAAEFLFPERYTDAKGVVYVVILCSLARSSYAVLGAVAEYCGLTIQKLKAVVVAGVFAIISTIVGVSNFGIMGAAIGVGVGYSVLTLTLWSYLAAHSRVQLRVPRGTTN